MSKLPYLAESNWPISKEPEERVVNPSYDKQLQDHLVLELMEALEKRDQHNIVEALHALFASLRDEESNEQPME